MRTASRTISPALPVFLAFVFVTSLLAVPAIAQGVRNFSNGNDTFVQRRLGQSERGVTFNFFGGNDRLILLRNDQFAGLGNGPVTFGAANMGEGRDLVFTSFNASGTFRLGPGDDFFYSDGDENFNGTALDIVVLAGPGNDVMGSDTRFCHYYGLQGDDVFASNDASNVFDGGEGVDTYSAEIRTNGIGVTIDLSTGSAPDQIAGVENIRGSPFSDNPLRGDNNNNRIDGLGGDDFIDALGGNDTVAGGLGSINAMSGGPGIDTLVVDGNVNSKSFNAPGSPGLLVVQGTLNGQPYAYIAAEFEQVLHNGFLKSIPFFMGQTSLNNVQQTVIQGARFAAVINGDNNQNTINGDATSPDIIFGLGNNDILRGFGGDDEVFGGPGADRLRGGNGNDKLNGGPGPDTLFGDLDNDDIRGNQGPDQIFGGLGDDIVNGGVGRDELFGGLGVDQFVLTANFAGNDDRIADYSVADDSIIISSTLVGLPSGLLSAANFKNTASGPIDADDRIIYRSDNGRLFFDSNGSAAGGLVLIARLSPGLAMTEAEILLQ